MASYENEAQPPIDGRAEASTPTADGGTVVLHVNLTAAAYDRLGRIADAYGTSRTAALHFAIFAMARRLGRVRFRRTFRRLIAPTVRRNV